MPDDPARFAPLDRPVWHALTGRQAGLAWGGGGALRFRPEYGPFAAAADASAGSLAALASLPYAPGGLWLVEDAIVPPAGLVVTKRAVCCQMVAGSVAGAVADFATVALGDEDAGEMRALAALTEPGPFSSHTHRLGGFIGVRVGGRLVAMAGQRMKPGVFTEVSGVCTHPDHRGRGYAGGLMRMVAQAILDRGEVPFLHCYANNAGAIALYETLGFAARRTIDVIVLERS